jgi:hypothetical protein
VGSGIWPQFDDAVGGASAGCRAQRHGAILPGVISSEGARLGEEAARRLARTGRYEIGPGLTDAEFARIEHDYGFEFADDHRAFLSAGLPLNRQGTYIRGDVRNEWTPGSPAVV